MLVQCLVHDASGLLTVAFVEELADGCHSGPMLDFVPRAEPAAGFSVTRC